MVATLNTTVIQNASSSTANITLDTAGNAAFGNMPYGTSSFLRNKIINGNMAVDQRNAGSSQTITAAAALAYTVDRWYGYCTGANVTGQQVQGATANQYRYQFTGAASVTAIGFGQRIEALNCADLAGTTATLSVVLSNSLLTTVTWTAYYANTTNTFGSLASPTVTQISTGTFTVTSTATTYSTNITIPSAATTGIQILFTVGSQTSGTWVIGNVQLEPGSVATPFERPLYSKQLADCQRYYSKSYDLTTVPGTATFTGAAATAIYSAAFNGNGTLNFIFPVEMRTAPTVTSYSTVNANTTGKCSSTTTDYTTNGVSANTRQAYSSATSSGGASSQLFYQWTASAEL